MTKAAATRPTGKAITIGIPAYNEERNILNLLHALEEQQLQLENNNNNSKSNNNNLSGGFSISEVIISDDSSDRTPELVSSFARHSELNIVHCHHGSRRGAAAAWNEIFRRATGDVLVLYDADTVPHPRCTQELASRLSNNTGICASRPEPAHARKGVAGRASSFTSSWLRLVRQAALSKYTVMGRALSLSAQTARLITIPHDVIAIDLYLQCRVMELGMDVAYNDCAIVYFGLAESMGDLASQVIRASNGHRQIRDYSGRFDLELPAGVAIAKALQAAALDLPGMLSLVAGYALLPYYWYRLAGGIKSARWHTAESSKAIDYEQLKARF